MHGSNFWSQKYDYPEIEQRSITSPIYIGRGPGSRQGFGPTLRNSSAHLWGRLGSGKTVVLADIVAGALQCTDCLVWTVGDELARAFMRPYLAGRTDVSPIDYVAGTSEELIKMADAGLAIAKARRSGYADLRYNANTIETPVGNGGVLDGPPHILIVVDDDWLFRGLKGSPEGKLLDATFEQLVRLSAAGAVSVVYMSTLRGEAPDWVLDLPTRIGLGITDPGDLMVAFGATRDSRPLEHAVRGGGHMREAGSEYLSLFKAYYLSPQGMDAVGQDTAVWRPQMDKLSMEAAGDVYRSRKERYPQNLLPPERPIEHRTPVEKL
jgi:hypothetical protein